VMTVEAAATLLDRDAVTARARLDDARRLARDASRELHDLIFELRPADLAHDGLSGTLRKHVEVLARVQPVELDLRIECEPRLAPEAQVEVFRVAQEAIGNALRHAGATRVAVRIVPAGGDVLLEVEDDGVGLGPGEAPPDPARAPGWGLLTMRERAAAVGASCEVVSHSGRGVLVRVAIGAGP